ncbi:hypothetical protein ACOMHN_004960 [Nucella lapillus]
MGLDSMKDRLFYLDCWMLLNRISCLCATWEAALQHGMKKNNKALSALRYMTEKAGLGKVTDFLSDVKQLEIEPAFWQYVKEHLTKHEVQRFNSLKQINTDMGRGRAWLRACLNEHSLERYMHMLIEKEDLIRQYYHEWAFMCDQERNSMLPTMSAGLGSVLFAILIDRPELNSPYHSKLHVGSGGEISVPGTADDEPRAVIADDSSPIVKRKEKKKKKKMANVVSFDEDKSEPQPRRHVASNKQHHTDTSNIAASVGNMNISEAGSGGRGADPLLQTQSSVTSTPSLFSASSLDGGSNLSSTGSVASFDRDVGHSFMVPVKDRGLVEDLNPQSQHPSFIPGSIHLDVSSEASVFSRGDVDNAVLALAVAQKGLDSARTEGDGGVSAVTLEHAHQNMSHDELRQAVVAMMLRKDEVERQNQSLQALLNQEMETSSTLRADMAQLRQTAAHQQECVRARLDKLQKENDLLKHQLKKYVNAVQLLRTEGATVKDDLGIHLDDQTQPSIPPPKTTIDYSQEASEYEQKLIQVAEMHGELMEFNEMLQRQLTAKDCALKQLRQELITLRGPVSEAQFGLPYSEQETEESGSPFMDSLSIQSRTLINIWIPSAFLRGTPSDQFHVYQVFVRIRDEEWNVFRRYSHFLDLHTRLKKVYPIVGKFGFPAKKSVGSKDSKVVEARRQGFQQYLRRVINFLQEKNPDLCSDTCRSRLVALLPFFGEDSEMIVKKGKKKGQQQKSQQSQPSSTPSPAQRNSASDSQSHRS